MSFRIVDHLESGWDSWNPLIQLHPFINMCWWNSYLMECVPWEFNLLHGANYSRVYVALLELWWSPVGRYGSPSCCLSSMVLTFHPGVQRNGVQQIGPKTSALDLFCTPQLDEWATTLGFSVLTKKKEGLVKMISEFSFSLQYLYVPVNHYKNFLIKAYRKLASWGLAEATGLHSQPMGSLVVRTLTSTSCLSIYFGPL